MSDKGGIELVCGHPWHETMSTSYCPSCGRRVDGRVTLANLSAMMLLGGSELRLERDSEVIKARITEVGINGVRFSDGTVVTGEEIHEWFVVFPQIMDLRQ